MNKKSWLILAGSTTILSLITLSGLFILHPCTVTIATAAGGSVPMKCHWTFRAEIPLAILLVLIAAGQFFLKGTEARRLSSLFIMAVAVVGYALTTDAVIGICAEQTGMMEACHTEAKFCWLLFALLIIASVLQLILSGKDASRHKREY